MQGQSLRPTANSRYGKRLERMFQTRIIDGSEKRSRYDLIPIQIYSSTRIIDKTTKRHWKGHREGVQSEGERCTVRKVGEREIQHLLT